MEVQFLSEKVHHEIHILKGGLSNQSMEQESEKMTEGKRSEIRPCPICGRVADLYVDMKERWNVGCNVCRNFATDEDWQKAVDLWNNVVSKECTPPKLKPCPFCGNAIPELKHDPKGDVYYVQCTSCDARGGTRRNKGYAYSSWNRRMDL